ncbi:MAG: CcmD family protein [Candidatus Binataceae bacterium]|jgi:CcmD family protein
MENLSYLVAAYTVIFAVIFLYLLFLWRRQRGLEDELHITEAKLDELRAELERGRPPQSRSSGH